MAGICLFQLMVILISSSIVRKESGKFMGYTFQTCQQADEFNQIFGFDKATGITPPNKLGILSNVEVVYYGGKFQYQLTSLPRFIAKKYQSLLYETHGECSCLFLLHLNPMW